MKPSRVAVYLFIALVVVLVTYYVLVQEPLPDHPVNLIHLLFKH